MHKYLMQTFCSGTVTEGKTGMRVCGMVSRVFTWYAIHSIGRSEKRNPPREHAYSTNSTQSTFPCGVETRK
jgi:hypothetical protein